jgi:hypothetical protein
MNKDLDARLIPNGEYREARNINISKSEGSDVGALENIKGNSSIVTTFLDNIQASIPAFEKLSIIGLYADESTSSLYLFITSWTDNSEDRLSNKFRGHNYIAQIIFNKNQYTPKILVKGQFLNFSKNSPIYNVDVLEGILYWTDNRNQPRKINVNKAYSSGGLSVNPNHNTDYYYDEDQISVAKFAPYDPIKFIKNTGSAQGDVWEPTWKIEDEEFLPISLTAPITAINQNADGDTTSIEFGNVPTSGRNGLDLPISNYFTKADDENFPLIKLRNVNLPNGGTRYVHEIDNRTVKPSESKNDTTASGTFPASWVAGQYVSFQLRNPQFKANESGDRKFLEDKFIRFSYRFKYVDNEYSLMAPFTQPLFISENFNQFLFDNEAQAARTGELSWFKNIISSAELIIQIPDLAYRGRASSSQPNLTFSGRYKVKEIEILLKSSTDNNIYSIDNIDVTNEEEFKSSFVSNSFTSWPYAFQYAYKYNGNKPFQVLPERDVTRVSDATPVRALTQEIAGNRVMYANYLNGHGAPNTLNYELFVSPKTNQYDAGNNPPIPASDPTVIKEYYSSTIKQGRTYQVGVVLSDRYGRQSNVILADSQFEDFTQGRDNSTIYVPYDNVGLSGSVDNFWGNSLKVAFRSEIPETPNPTVDFYPGLYNSSSNPLGWYSYKIVVKQSEQEYYNVYLAGALSGTVVYKSNSDPLEYANIYKVSNIALLGGNINKIPKNTSNISSTDKTFSSDTSLTYRVIQTQFDANSVYNNFQVPAQDVQPFSVTGIQSFFDFAPWAKTKGGINLGTGVLTAGAYPRDLQNQVYIDPFRLADRNPFIATLDLGNWEKFRLGFQASTQKGDSDPSALDYQPPRFSKFLHVAETNPTLSELDIYWETTTSGLISDLNSSIRSGGDPDAVVKTNPFLFLYEEQYPYDGKGAYAANGNGPGDYLLQRNLIGLNSSGQDIDGTDVTMGEPTSDPNVFDIIVKTVDGVDVSSLFVIELVKEGNNNEPREFNIRFRDANVVENSYYIPNVGLLLQKELIFTIKLSRPGFNPPTTTVQYSNNKMSNNKPKWEYIKPATWGDDADEKPNPNNTSDVIITPNAEYIDNNIIIGLECVPLSPFTPVSDDVIKDMLQANGGGLGTKTNATYYDPYRNQVWNLSIKGQTNAPTSSSFLSWSSTSLGDGMFGNNNNIWADKSFDNSAVRFNARMVGDPGDSTNGLFKYSNGSFIREKDGVTPIITNIELALFTKDTSYEDYDKNQSILPGYGNQGALPIEGYSPFLFTAAQQNDTGLTLYNQGGIQRYSYPENFPPFVIRPLQNGLSYLVNTSKPNNTQDITGLQGVYCLLVDPYHPPFNQFDSKQGNNFDPLGNLTNGDLVVYKLTVVLREDFAPNKISNPQQIFIKLSK